LLDPISAFIIGALQGFMEWIPISSSGQITIALIEFFRVNPAEAYNLSLTLHLGTALSASIYFKKQVSEVLGEIFGKRNFRTAGFKIFIVTAIFSLITAVPSNFILERKLQTIGSGEAMGIIGIFLIITGILLTFKKKVIVGLRGINDFSIFDAVILGIIQGFSILPGISRSAITIITLLILKFNLNEAFKISFMASIPVSIMAGIYGLISQTSLNIALSLTSAMLFGLISMGLMLKTVERAPYHIMLIILGIMLTAPYLLTQKI